MTVLQYGIVGLTGSASYADGLVAVKVPSRVGKALDEAEIRCRELMMSDFSGWHTNNSEFTSERDAAGQMVVDIDFVLQQQGAGAWDGSLKW